MLLLIILAVIAIATGIGSYFWEKEHEYECGAIGFVLMFSCLLSALTVIVMLLCIPDVNTSGQETINNYEFTKTLVQNAQSNDYGNLQPIVEEVVEVNKKISSAKAYENDIWIGCFYSKKVAKLDYLAYPAPKGETVELNEEDASE